MDFRVLCLGDVVGRPGRRAVTELLPELIRERRIDAVVANGENIAGGSGLTETLAQKLWSAGVDVITSGDHVWRKQAFAEVLRRDRRALRPHNYSKEAAGRGVTVVQTPGGVPIGVINVLGRVFMEPVNCPFQAVDEALEWIGDRARIIVVDVHAEATSEKIALGRYLDGRVSAVVGTHTHVPTADEQVFPKGTAYVTDLGMCGPYESVIGRAIEPVLYRFTTQMWAAFDVAEHDARISGVLITVDRETGRARDIERVHVRLPAAVDADAGTDGDDAEGRAEFQP